MWHSTQFRLTVFSRRFQRKCTTFTVASFFSSVQRDRSTFLLFVQHHQLEPRTSKTYSKHQNLVQNKNIDVQNFENIGKIPPLVFFTRIFFGTMRFFLKFLDSTKGSPLRLFRYFATQWMSKNLKGSLLHFSAL